MFKKIVKKTLITLVVVLIAFSYCFYNLKHYSVFYAKHTPHKAGVEPVLMELVDNLDYIIKPEIEGIRYDFDGSRSIHNANCATENKVPWFCSVAIKNYLYSDNEDIDYLFNNKFELTSYGNREVLSMDLNKVDVVAIKKDIYKTVKPVIDAQPAPSINLQWLYDQLNKERFN